MPATCPRCGVPVRSDAPSCRECGYVLAPAAATFITLTFPAEHPDYDVPQPDARARAAAPTLMPSVRPLPVAPPAPHEVPGAPRRTPVAAIVGAVAFLAVVGVVVTMALLGGGDDRRPAAPLSNDSPGRQAADSTFSAQDTPPPTPVPTDEDSALRLLQERVAHDRGAVEALVEHWVPQLSSKKPGLEVNGTVFNYQAIWSDFTSLTARYPDALLLWSGDYTSFRYGDFWVTVVPQQSDSGELANGWCDSAGIDKDNCFAKRISHTGSYADSTLLRK